jgi:hypothetical protein
MKNILHKHLGQSWKTTLVSYLLAVMLALQPLLDAEVDLSKKYALFKYIIRLVFAAGVAFFGKYAADSSQVKQVQKQIDREP